MININRNKKKKYEYKIISKNYRKNKQNKTNIYLGSHLY